MNKLMYVLLLPLLLAITVAGCKKDDDDNNNAGACNSGFNFCVEKDGSLIEGTASFRIISTSPPRYRVTWEEGSGAQYKNIEIDIYADATGTYGVDSSLAQGTAAFQYFDAVGYYGGSGTVEVTAVSTTEISGTFNAMADDGNGTVFDFTNGNFVNVPVQ